MKAVLTLIIVLVSLNLFGQSQWITQSPRPEHFDVKYINENTLIRVGEDGIFKSSDNGESWLKKWKQNQWDPSSKIYLNRVFFANESIGWVSGNSNENHRSGYLLKTVDGGESWELLANFNGDGIKDIFFSDSEIGWIATGTCCPDEKSGKILKTTNGGNNWVVSAENFQWIYKSLHFVNRDVGWAVGENYRIESGFIVKTTDGGTSWIKQRTEENLFDAHQIFFTDEMNGWCFLNYYDSNYSYPAAIYSTSDGGENWVNNFNFEANKKFYTDYGEINFIDNYIGFFRGNFKNNSYDIKGYLFKTTDGGHNWTTQLESEIYRYNALDIFNREKIYVVGSNGGKVTSSDGGLNWVENSSAGNEHFFSIFPVNTNLAFAAGQSGKIVKTIDGGNNWFGLNTGYDENLNSIYFADENIGWAVGGSSITSGKIVKTTNGGDDWISTPDQFPALLNSVYFTDQFLGWAVGYNGTILKTTDGGENWISQNSLTTNILESVHFVNDSTGWIVGENLTILHTTNAGEHWSKQTASATSFHELRSVCFIDEQNGWVAGTGEFISNTTDGGNSWNVQYQSGTGEFSSIIFRDSEYGWASNFNGKIYFTYDGGNNWNESDDFTNNNLLSVNFVDDTVGYSAGSNGTILRYYTNYQYNVPEKVVLTYPENNETNAAIALDMNWNFAVYAESYRLQISKDPQFNNLNFDEELIQTLNKTISGLERDTKYYWRVRASNSLGTGEWSEVWQFTTKNIENQNWYIYHNQIENDFTSISFIDKYNGWATVGIDRHTFSDTYYQTTDGGVNWEPKSADIDRFVDIEFSNSSLGIAGISDSEFPYNKYALTTDGGNTWTKFGAIFHYNTNKIIFLDGSKVYALMRENGLGNYQQTVFKFDIKSMSFNSVGNPGFGGNRGNKLYADFVNENTGWVVGKEANGSTYGYNLKRAFIYKTTDGGTGWNLQYEEVVDYDSVDSEYIYFTDVDAVDENNIWVSARKSGGIILNSTDGGQNWNIKFQNNFFTNLSYPLKISFADPNNGCAIIRNETLNGNDDYLLQTSDGGETWHPQYLNLFTTLFDIQMVDSTMGYVVGKNGLVLKFQDSTTVVGIAGNEPNLPTNFELAQNYPNPFNPETKIKFSLPKNSKVVLEVYNILGQKVRELVNTDLEAGYHEVNFNSRGLASGIYIYRLKAKEGSGKNHNQFMEVKKMILLK